MVLVQACRAGLVQRTGGSPAGPRDSVAGTPLYEGVYSVGGVHNIWSTLPTTIVWKSPKRLGSVCSGMKTDHWAVPQLHWAFEEVFWCENDLRASKFIMGIPLLGDVPHFSDVLSVSSLQMCPVAIC